MYRIAARRVFKSIFSLIADVEADRLGAAPSLLTVDLRNNPLTIRCHDQLSEITHIEISLTPREREDWEDLTI